MARIAYDDTDAAAFETARHVADDGLTAWRTAQLITDDEYVAGLARLRQAAATATGPVTDALDLLVFGWRSRARPGRGFWSF